MMANSTAALAKCIVLVMLVVSHDGSVDADIAVISCVGHFKLVLSGESSEEIGNLFSQIVYQQNLHLLQKMKRTKKHLLVKKII